MQPNHLNLIDALMNTEHAGIAGLDNQCPNCGQRWKILALLLQETEPFRLTSRRKVNVAETADFDRPGETILQCNGDGSPSERPLKDQQNRRNTENDCDESSYDEAPPPDS